MVLLQGHLPRMSYLPCVCHLPCVCRLPCVCCLPRVSHLPRVCRLPHMSHLPRLPRVSLPGCVQGAALLWTLLLTDWLSPPAVLHNLQADVSCCRSRTQLLLCCVPGLSVIWRYTFLVCSRVGLA